MAVSYRTADDVGTRHVQPAIRARHAGLLSLDPPRELWLIVFRRLTGAIDLEAGGGHGLLPLTFLRLVMGFLPARSSATSAWMSRTCHTAWVCWPAHPGWMLAFWWNRFCGSYFALILASRSYLAGP